MKKNRTVLDVILEVDEMIAFGNIGAAREVVFKLIRNQDQPPLWLLDRWFLINPGWHDFLEDERIRLRPPTENDLPFFMGALGDDTFVRQVYPMSIGSRSQTQILSGLQKTPLSVVKSNQAYWVIELKKTADQRDQNLVFQPVGLIGLVDIKIAHRRAELIVGLPGEDLLGGVALRACLHLIEHAFSRLDLNKIVSVVLSSNQHSQKSTLSLGFQEEGFRRAHLKDPVTKNFLDCHENGMLKEDFFENSRLNRLRQRLLKQL